MSDLYDRIEQMCSTQGINITEMCREAGVPRSALSDYKVGRKKSISLKNVEKIADYFDTTVDYLLGRTDDPENRFGPGISVDELMKTGQKESAPALTKKDERDIARRLEEMLDLMSPSSGSLMFDGEPIDDETRELLRASLQNQLEMSKRLAKQKYTPKKYRNKEGE
jgi:transcriptional regulator with XRE-family HTH domain